MIENYPYYQFPRVKRILIFLPETEVYRNPGYSLQSRVLLIDLSNIMDLYERIKKKYGYTLSVF